MTLDPMNLLAIVAMAAVTYATRVAGLWFVHAVRPTPLVQAALDAVPVAVLTAVIAPSLMKGGPADIAAAAIMTLAAFRLPLLPAVVIGVVSVVLLRAWVAI